MPSATDRSDLAPRHEPGALRAFGLAVVVHLLLIGALTWGINWKHSDPDLSFEAELWSSVPQEAAPKLVEAPPAPPPPPPPPPEAPRVQAPPPPAPPEVDIALEREKQRKLDQKKQEAQDKLQAELKDKEDKLKAQKEQDRLKALQAKKDKEQQAREDLAKRKAEEERKQEAKKAEDKKAEAKQLAADKAEAQKLAEQRKKNLERIAGLAGASGAANATGSALKASGPSASYAGKVRAKVKPNIVFTEAISGNPKAEVEVRTALDGSIISQRLIKSSGNTAWDDAVIKAIIRSESLPRDVDGRVPTPMILEFRPKD